MSAAQPHRRRRAAVVVDDRVAAVFVHDEEIRRLLERLQFVAAGVPRVLAALDERTALLREALDVVERLTRAAYGYVGQEYQAGEQLAVKLRAALGIVETPSPRSTP